MKVNAERNGGKKRMPRDGTGRPSRLRGSARKNRK